MAHWTSSYDLVVNFTKVNNEVDEDEEVFQDFYGFIIGLFILSIILILANVIIYYWTQSGNIPERGNEDQPKEKPIEVNYLPEEESVKIDPLLKVVPAEMNLRKRDVGRSKADPIKRNPLQEAEHNEMKPVQVEEPIEGNPLQEAEPFELNHIKEVDPIEMNSMQEAKLIEMNPLQEAEPNEMNPIQKAEPNEMNPIQKAEPNEMNPIQEAETIEMNPIQEAEPIERNHVQEAEPLELNHLQEAGFIIVNPIRKSLQEVYSLKIHVLEETKIIEDYFKPEQEGENRVEEVDENKDIVN